MVAQNYLANKARFLGLGNYTEEGMSAMQKSIPLSLAVFKQALATPNLKIVLGTDAVAGAHGHNAEELVVRVRNRSISATRLVRLRREWKPISSESRAIRSKILRLYGGLFSL